MMHHFGDPCIHCGILHDEVEVGSCDGDAKKAKPIAYKQISVRWDNVAHYRIRFSDGHIEDRWEHISMQAPYFHFGYSNYLIHPPRYDVNL